MSLTVIVPTCGRPTLENTVRSALKQMEPGDEVLVVGPRKPEVEHEQLRWLQYDNMGCDPTTLRPRRRETEPGYASGAIERDLGREAAKTTHITVIDDDDVHVEGALAAYRDAIAAAPDLITVFRVQYGDTRQWVSQHALDVGTGYTYDCYPKSRVGMLHNAPPFPTWVLWGQPRLMLGEVGSAMCVFPNDPLLRWERSAPGGAKNVSEDYWVVQNYVNATGKGVRFDPRVVALIRPAGHEVSRILGEAVPEPRYCSNI